MAYFVFSSRLYVPPQDYLIIIIRFAEGVGTVGAGGGVLQAYVW